MVMVRSSVLLPATLNLFVFMRSPQEKFLNQRSPQEHRSVHLRDTLIYKRAGEGEMTHGVLRAWRQLHTCSYQVGQKEAPQIHTSNIGNVVGGDALEGIGDTHHLPIGRVDVALDHASECLGTVIELGGQCCALACVSARLRGAAAAAPLPAARRMLKAIVAAIAAPASALTATATPHAEGTVLPRDRLDPS